MCVISFSSRKDGNCAKIAELVCSLLPDAERYEFSDFELRPCGRCGYECMSGGRCVWDDGEYELLDAVIKSSETYFIIPNYCDYPCANFFIFNERSNGYFQKRQDLLEKYLHVPKKAIVVSGTEGENFRKALSYHCDNEMPLLLLSAKKYGKNSVDGDILTSKEAVQEIKSFVLGEAF